MSATVGDADDILAAAIELGDLLQGRFGPHGRKILYWADGSVTVTGDVHRLFDVADLPHPVARLVAGSVVQQKEIVGDGSLAVALLTASLAKRATDLLADGFRRRTIQDGFERARRAALADLPTFAHPVAGIDDPAIRGVARASLATEHLDSEPLVDVVLEAVEIVDESRRGRNSGVDLADVTFQIRSTTDDLGVELVRGVVLEREPVSEETPQEIQSPRVAVIGGGKKAGTGIEERSLRREGGSKGKGRTEVTFQAETADDVQALADHEAADVGAQVQTLVDADVDAVFSTRGISDEAIARLADAGIVAFRALQAWQARRISRATGATVVMGIDNLRAEHIGRAGNLRVETDDDATTVRLDDCAETAVCTVLVSGALSESVAELERDLRTAVVATLDALDSGTTVPGGGGIERLLARSVRESGWSLADRRAVVMDAYADALEDVPRTLAANSGLDATTVLTTLRAAPDDAGLDCRVGEVQRVVPDGPQTTERVVSSVINAATDLTVQLVRIDAVLPAADEEEPTDFDFRPDPERDLP